MKQDNNIALLSVNGFDDKRLRSFQDLFMTELKRIEKLFPVIWDSSLSMHNDAYKKLNVCRLKVEFY